MRQTFSLLRFVPDTARGEFVNIGAIAGDDAAGEWELRLVSNLRRAKAIDDRGLLPSALSYAAAFEDHISGELDLLDGAEPMSSELLRRSASDLSNVLQMTMPAPVAADSPGEALDIVFEHLVLDAGRRVFDFEKKHRALKAVRRTYAGRDELRHAVKQRAPVASGVYDGTFDFAVHNGHAVQLVQCWSFQLPNQAELAEQVKAWSWLVHEIRRGGGQLQIGDTAIDVPADLAIFSVVIPPRKSDDAPAYDEAQAAFQENDVVELQAGETTPLGDQAVAALTTA